MNHRRTVEVRTVHQTWSRGGSGEGCVAEVKPPRPDAMWQVLKGIEGDSAVSGQLASGHRDHAARPDAQQVIPAGMERRSMPPGQDAQPRETRDDSLAAEYLGA